MFNKNFSSKTSGSANTVFYERDLLEVSQGTYTIITVPKWDVSIRVDNEEFEVQLTKNKAKYVNKVLEFVCSKLCNAAIFNELLSHVKQQGIEEGTETVRFNIRKAFGLEE